MEFLIGIDLIGLIRAVGYAGVFAIVFAESGLLIGFFLPGDSLLFTAGFMASQGFFDILFLIAGTFAAAVFGDSVGYAFGRRVGPAIFRREESLLFNPRNFERARRFYERYGGLTIVLARFLPAIRTFAPILAGVGRMGYRRFVAFNVIGAVIWAIGVPLVGFWLGSVIPGVGRYLLPIIAAIIATSLIPPFIAAIRDPSRRALLVRTLRVNVLTQSVLLRRTIGIALLAFGVLALVIPFFPFAWLALVGLKLLGVPLPFEEKVKAWWQKQTPTTKP